ncbi:MAG: hypothetical protein PWR31_856 [Bacillota bacterium]|jgi:UPF0755 protein|nr:hypothetical protein [Bacillota bacterium]
MQDSPVQTRRARKQVVLLGLVGAFFVFVTALGALEPVHPGQAEATVVQIAPEATAGEIAALLQEKGIIRSALAFRLLAKLTGQEAKLQAGRYLLSPGRSPGEILAVLAQGKMLEEQIRVTIPEGYSVRQIAVLLGTQGVTDEAEFLSVARAGELSSRFFADPPSPEVEFRWEGFFFPDTYFFHPHTPAAEVAQRMLARMDQVWVEETRGTPELPLGFRPREVVTLASLVEKEAKAESERPLVARVFYNRLKANMNLQSCATVQYLLPAPKPHLLDADTRLPSPYNTYLHPGLPPGPIASPGRSSLRAALSPGEGAYLYFVAKPDGTHAFSLTYREHLNNQQRYQK